MQLLNLKGTQPPRFLIRMREHTGNGVRAVNELCLRSPLLNLPQNYKYTALGFKQHLKDFLVFNDPLWLQ